MSNKEGKFRYLMRVMREASFKKLKITLDHAHERSGKNRFLILLDMINCTIRYGSGYNDYVIFEFWNLNHRQRSTYMTRMKSKKFIMFMNDHDYAHYFDNKNEFNEKFKDYIGREVIDLETATDDDIKNFAAERDKLFAKMKDLSCGKGCELLETKNFDSPDSLVNYVREKGFATLEDVIVNHPDIARLYPFAANTMRMITVVDAQGKAHCIYAVLKMGMNGRIVDNFGLQGPVDLATGKFLYPAHSGDTKSGKHYTEHPYSHIPLVGFKVPYMREAVALVEKAALVVPQMRYIGWDVAVTAKGPVIIEGNDYNAHDFWQLPGQTPGGIGIIPTIQKIVPEYKW